MFRFFALAAVFSAALAQIAPQRGPRAQSGAAAAPAQGEPAVVRGTVVGAGNEPLRKAEVTLRGVRGGAGTLAATTDPSGAFRFDGVPPGTYTISVQRTGYVRAEYGAKAGSRGGAAVTVSPGQDLGGIAVKLTPHAVLTGKVTDEDGDPVQHASIQVLRERWINGKRQLVTHSADSSNDLGEYRIAGLSPGRYWLMASLSRHPMDPASRASGAAETGYAPLYYPGVAEPSQASPIAVAAGQQTAGVDFQLRKTAVYRVRGKVLDENGKPAMYAGVMAVPLEGFTGPRGMGMVRGADGAFEIANLPPGAYNVIVNRGGREERRLSAQTQINVGNRDVDDVVLQLQRAFDIAGAVRAAGEGVAVSAVRVSLESMQSGPFFGMPDTQIKDGQFTISGVTPGKYRFNVQNLPPGAYVKSVSVQGQDISGGAAIGAAATGVEIVLGAQAAEVGGVALDKEKQPLPGAWVVLAPETALRERYWLFKTAVAGSDGAFSIRNIPPGQYTLFILDDVEEGAWHDPEFLDRIQSSGVSLKLAEGAKETVQAPVAR